MNIVCGGEKEKPILQIEQKYAKNAISLTLQLMNHREIYVVKTLFRLT